MGLAVEHQGLMCYYTLATPSKLAETQFFSRFTKTWYTKHIMVKPGLKFHHCTVIGQTTRRLTVTSWEFMDGILIMSAKTISLF